MKLVLIIGPLVLGFLVTSTVVVGRQLMLTHPTVARTIGYPMPVRAVAAEQVELTESIGANGDIQPITLVNLTAKASTRVKKVTVDLESRRGTSSRCEGSCAAGLATRQSHL